MNGNEHFGGSKTSRGGNTGQRLVSVLCLLLPTKNALKRGQVGWTGPPKEQKAPSKIRSLLVWGPETAVRTNATRSYSTINYKQDELFFINKSYCTSTARHGLVLFELCVWYLEKTGAPGCAFVGT